MPPGSADDTSRRSEYALLVFLVNQKKPARFVFDQPTVLVGRGDDADLRIEHAAVSRRQFLVERGVGSAGEARFRITPYETLNQTLVNDRPAVEGTLMPGDVIAIGEMRITLERDTVKKGRRTWKKVAGGAGEGMPISRMLLLGAVVVMAIVVGYLFIGESGDDSAAEIANAQAKLFQDGALGTARCANAMECETRAHEAYAKGKKLVDQAGADPGNLYRATIELDRAAKFRELSGKPLGDMADVVALRDKTRGRAEAEFQDAKFRLTRAIAAGDYKRCYTEATLLAKIVPEDQHPYRVKLDAYRRTLGKPKQKGIGDDWQ